MTASEREHQSVPDKSTADASREFLERGEVAWQSYLRTGESRSAEEVIARLQVALDARLATLSSKYVDW
jgi:hypothetical protein